MSAHTITDRVHQVYKWAIAGTLSSATFMKPVPLSGLVGLVAADCLYLFSLEFVRRRFFHAFIVVHVLGVIVFLAAVSCKLILVLSSFANRCP